MGLFLGVNHSTSFSSTQGGNCALGPRLRVINQNCLEVRATCRVVSRPHSVFLSVRAAGEAVGVPLGQKLGVLENFSVKLEKEKTLKFTPKKKKKKCRLGFSQQCWMFGGNLFKKASGERIVVSYEEKKKKPKRRISPNIFFPSQKGTFPLKMKKLDQTISF